MSPLLSPSPGLGLTHALVQLWEEQPNGHFHEAKVTQHSVGMCTSWFSFHLSPVTSQAYSNLLPRWASTLTPSRPRGGRCTVLTHVPAT